MVPESTRLPSTGELVTSAVALYIEALFLVSRLDLSVAQKYYRFARTHQNRTNFQKFNVMNNFENWHIISGIRYLMFKCGEDGDEGKEKIIHSS